MPMIINSVNINAGFDLVFDMTNDIENWPGLFTEYKEARILKREGNCVLFQLTTHPDEEQKSRNWVSARLIDKENRKIIAKRIEPLFPFKQMDIEWHYNETDGVTEMVWIQEFEVDPECGYTEEQITNHLSHTSKEQMASIKMNIEKTVGSHDFP